MIQLVHTHRRSMLIGLVLYLAFATLDSLWTLHGIGGDITLEGNPFLRSLMLQLGPLNGLLLGKGLVLGIALLMTNLMLSGIDRDADWIYSMALTRMSRGWMRRRKRYWIAFVPIYTLAFAQGFAALTWAWLVSRHGVL